MRVRVTAAARLAALGFVLAGCGSAASGQTLPSAAPSAPTGSAASSTMASASTPLPTPQPGDAQTAARQVDTYITDLVGRRWRPAWDLLSSDNRPTIEAFTDERSAFFKSVAGRFMAKDPTHDAAVLANWLQSPTLAPSANLGRAFVVEVDYPALSGNNAGFEIYLAAPDRGGTWRVWLLR